MSRTFIRAALFAACGCVLLTVLAVGAGHIINGRILAYTDFHSGNSEIYLLDLNSGLKLNLTQNPGDDNTPIWSPDGERLLFATDRNFRLEYFVVNVDGSDQAVIFPNTSQFARYPAWSDDGEHILFVQGDAVNYDQVYSATLGLNGDTQPVDLDSPEVQTYLSRLAFSRSGRMPSPVSGEILTVESRDGDWSIVRVMDNQSQRVYGISQFAAYNGPTPVWSPDGTQIAFVDGSGTQMNVYIMDADGSHVRLVVRGGTSPVWRP